MRTGKKLITLPRTLHSSAYHESYNRSFPCCSGGLADILGGGEDFLGLRELGIEAEFGLKSLSVPKRLWKGKSNAEDRAVLDR